jgi:hypothetical protein
LPFESRVTISIMRPPSPPAALNFSTSIVIALRDEMPSWATRPERMVGTPTRIGLFCARDTKGKPNPVAAVSAPAALMNPRRLRSVAFFSDMISPLYVRATSFAAVTHTAGGLVDAAG